MYFAITKDIVASNKIFSVLDARTNANKFILLIIYCKILESVTALVLIQINTNEINSQDNTNLLVDEQAQRTFVSF